MIQSQSFNRKQEKAIFAATSSNSELNHLKKLQKVPYLVNTYLDMRKRQLLNGTMTCRHHHGWLQRKLLHFCIKKRLEKAFLKHCSRMLALYF